MTRVSGCAIAMVLACACSRREPRSNGEQHISQVARDTGSTAADSEPRAVPARTGADSARVRQIRALRLRIDSQLKGHAPRPRLFAAVGDSVVTVRDTSAWPEETDVSYAVLEVAGGKIRFASESPTSRSGDWFVLDSYYFDEGGRTVLVRRFQSSFQTACDDTPVKEITESYYGPDLQLLQRDYRLTNAHDVRVDPEQCRPYIQDAPRLPRTWEAFAQATGLGRFFRRP